MDSRDELVASIREMFPTDAREFRPCAFFDSRLDCIRVFTRDCSSTEERINDRLTVLVDNYPAPDANKFVGFTIKGVRHFCQEYGLGLKTSVRVTALLDALIASYPDAILEVVVNHIARPLIDENMDEVELTDAA